MQGYVARKGDRYDAVIYEGIDPLTGRERRRWYPAGTDRAVAETLACDLAERRRGGGHERCSLTVAVYLTQRWLPSKQVTLRPSTWDAYRRVVDLHVVPRIGRIPLRHLRPDRLERLCADLLDDGRADGTGGLNNKTVVEIHMILRRALDDAPEASCIRKVWVRASSTTAAAGSSPTRPGSPMPPNADRCRATHHECGTPNSLQRSSPRPQSSLPRRAVGHRQHRHATRRDPRAPLGRRRLPRVATVRHTLARLSRLRTPRNARQVPYRPAIDQARPAHRRHPARLAPAP